jgi:transcription antitermination factor NusG
MRHGRPVLASQGRKTTEQILRPFFPGYLFVELDLDTTQDWGAITRTPGVRSLLSTQEHRPLPVPYGIVEALMEQGRAGDGAIDPGTAPKFPPLARGQAVRVTLGGADIDSVVQMTDQERVWVLLRLFDRETVTEVPRGSVRER